MPVRYRRWFLQRLVRHFEEKNELRKKATEPLKQQDNSESLDMFSRFENQVKNKLS
jgi:hypothetical protein